MKFNIFNVLIIIITLSYQSTVFWYESDAMENPITNLADECPSESEDTYKSIDNCDQVCIQVLDLFNYNYLLPFMSSPDFLSIHLNKTHFFSIEIPPEV